MYQRTNLSVFMLENLQYIYIYIRLVEGLEEKKRGPLVVFIKEQNFEVRYPEK